MSTTSKVMYSVRALERLPKDTSSDMELLVQFSSLRNRTKVLMLPSTISC
jgi:hypothetical protein